MLKPIVLALPSHPPRTDRVLQESPSSHQTAAKHQSLPPNPRTQVVKLESYCQPMTTMMRKAEPIKVQNVKEQRHTYFSKNLKVRLKKAAAQSRAPTSWTLLRGKERRENIRHIMQTLKRNKNANPYSVAQFESFKKTLEEYGQLEEASAAAMSPNRSTPSSPTRVSDFGPAAASHCGNYDRFFVNQSVNLDFGDDYGNRAFLELVKDIKSGDLLRYTLYRDMMTGAAGRYTAVQGLRYLSDDVMQLWSLEEVSNEFSKQKHY